MLGSFDDTVGSFVGHDHKHRQDRRTNIVESINTTTGVLVELHALVAAGTLDEATGIIRGTRFACLYAITLTPEPAGHYLHAYNAEDKEKKHDEEYDV